MKAQIVDFLVRTQKATAALLGAATAASTATFVPPPWNGYAATVAVALTWLLTYAIPFVSKAVQALPFAEPASDPDHKVSSAIEVQVVEDDAPLVGEVIEPTTVGIPVQRATTTQGIPVVEGERTFVPPFTGAISVDEILARLQTEQV